MRNAILAASTLLGSLALSAADYKPLDVKLGLWESSVTNQTSGMPAMPEELLSKLPPEQRARMEAAMKARQAKGPQTTTTKSCLTKEQLEKAMAFGNEGNAICKRTIVNSSSTKQDIQLDCSDPRMAMKGSGSVHLEAINSENIKGTSQITTGAGARTMNIEISFAAKWLGADCGDLGKK